MENTSDLLMHYDVKHTHTHTHRRCHVYCACCESAGERRCKIEDTKWKTDVGLRCEVGRLIILPACVSTAPHMCSTSTHKPDDEMDQNTNNIMYVWSVCVNNWPHTQKKNRASLSTPTFSWGPRGQCILKTPDTTRGGSVYCFAQEENKGEIIHV